MGLLTGKDGLSPTFRAPLGGSSGPLMSLQPPNHLRTTSNGPSKTGPVRARRLPSWPPHRGSGEAWCPSGPSVLRRRVCASGKLYALCARFPSKRAQRDGAPKPSSYCFLNYIFLFNVCKCRLNSQISERGTEKNVQSLLGSSLQHQNDVCEDLSHQNKTQFDDQYIN